MTPPPGGLQGGILKGHGRDHSVWLLVRFTSAFRARAWLGRIARTHLTSAAEQDAQAEAFKLTGAGGGLFGSVALSRTGYAALGLVAPADAKFIAGMKASQAALADPAVSAWEPLYQGDLHAVVVLAHDDENALGEAVRTLYPPTGVEILGSEIGRAMRNDDLSVNEHFGYADGISQPPDPSIVALVPDPSGQGYGSYLVFRKLEQDVEGFEAAEEALGAALGVDKELAGGFAVGRFENGTPLVEASAEQALRPPARPDNAFDYSGDPAGSKCPYHGHIRAMNDRATVGRARIVRRGATYGQRGILPKDNPPPDMLPVTGFGLLFACYQADVGAQFEALQVQANAVGDPIIGQAAPAPTQSWPSAWGAAGRTPFSFGQHVRLKGGEYFFAPSMALLRGLS